MFNSIGLIYVRCCTLFLLSLFFSVGLTVKASAQTAVYQIACGSSSAVSPYTADQFYAGGGPLSTGSTIDTSGVSNPAPMAVYQGCRDGYYGNSITYTLPGLTSGSAYTVRLHFAETQYSAQGQRCFNVAINGTTVLPNFDIYTATGAENKAIVEQFNATADSGGHITVQLTQGTAGDSVISGLELYTGSSTPSTPINLLAIAGNGQVALTWNSVYGSTSYNVKRATTSGGPYTTVGSPTSASYTDSGLVNGTTYYYVVTAVNASGESAASTEVSGVPTTGNAPVYRINCGGGASAPYVADEFVSGGGISGTGNAIDTSGVSNPAPTAVYQIFRFNTVTYTLPGLTPGSSYNVRLHFADPWDSFVGQRVFDILINGATVQSNFDIIAAAGAANKAVVEQFNTTADTSGNVTVQLSGSAMINGLELYTGSSAPSVPINLLAIAENAQVALTWNAVNGATSYNVKRATVSGGPYTTIASPTTASYTDSGLTNGNTYYYVVTAVNASGESAASNEVSGIPTTGNAPVYKINCGGGASAPYVADEFFSGGGTSGTGNAIDTSGASNPAPTAVYQIFRFNNVTYTLPGLTPGSPYTVRLHFADPWDLSVGQRVFDILINGATVVSNFDIIAAAGSANKAVVEQFNATADSSGNVTVQLNGQPIINGLELYTGASAPSVPINLRTIAGNGEVTLTWNVVGGATSYNVKRATVTGGPYTTISSPTSAAYTDTSLVNGTTYFYVVTAVNGSGESAPSNEASATPMSGNAPVYQINCGGGAVSPYVADEYFSGGDTPTTGNTIDTSGVSNPAPMAVYQSCRDGYYGNTVTYTLPGLISGAAYTVRLHFVEAQYSSPGQRCFNVIVNGTTVLPNFDIFAAAGAANKAIVEQFNTTADTSGDVTVQLTQGSADTSVISGLELYTGSESPSTPINLLAIAGDGQVALTWNVVNGAVSYNVKRATVSGGPYTTVSSPTSSAYTDTGLANGTTYFYVVTAVNASGESAPSNEVSATPTPGNAPIYHINCGGGAVSPYVADEFFSGGDTPATGNTIDTSGVSNPAPMAVYQSCRHGYYGNTVTYTLPGLTSGAVYTVRLHFVETQYSFSGQRRFNVSINGTTVLPNFDIFTVAGAVNKAVVEQFNATADTSGNVTVQLTQGSADTSVISGLELYTGSSAPSTPINLLAIAGNEEVALSWNVVNGAASYNVKRATASGGPYTTISSPTSSAYTDTGLVNGTTYFYVVTAVNANGESAPSNEVSAVPTTGNAVIYQINCGGGAVSPYVADEFFSGGDILSTGNTIDTSGVSNPAPMAVYQTCRRGYYGNTVTYTVPGLTFGSPYTVRMHFAETQYSFSGLRCFNASINGATVLSNFDVFAAAGAANKAVVEQFNATADISGDVTVQLTQGSADDSVISGLEITSGQSVLSRPFGLQAVAGHASVNLGWTGFAAATGYNVYRATVSGGPYTLVTTTPVTACTYLDSSLINGTTYFYVVTAVNDVGESSYSNEASATPNSVNAGVYKINCGGPAVADWATDEFFVGGNNIGNASPQILTGVADPAPAAVYATARSGTATYTLPYLIPNNQYAVRLHFCDPFNAAGMDFQNVSINGAAVLTNFDVNANTLTPGQVNIQQFDAEADADGKLTIVFTNVVGTTEVCGIEVLTDTTETLTPPALQDLQAWRGNTQVGLSWPPEVGATGYNVKRSLVSGGPYTTIATNVTDASYSDPTTSNYYYVVTATNSSGEGPNSNEAYPVLPFVLSADPTSLDIAHPGYGFARIAASSTVGFTGTILYSTSAIPANVNCVLYPASSFLETSTIIGLPVSTTTMVQFCANGAASTGTQPITVSGTSGDYTATAVVNLSIH